MGLVANGNHEFLDFAITFLADGQVGDHFYESGCRCRRHGGDAAATGNGFLRSRDFQEPSRGMD